MMTALLFIVMAMLGTIVQTVSGFGFAIIAMMVFPFLTGNVTTAASIAGLFALTNASMNAYTYREHIEWRIVLLPFAAYMVFGTIALECIGKMSNEWMLRLLGVALICAGLYFFFFQSRIKIKPTKKNAFLAGSISGVLGSLFAIAGPPMALYYTMLIENNKYKYLGCINAYFLLTNTYISILRACNGFLGLVEIKCWLVGLIGLVLGRVIGGKLLDKVDGVFIKKIVYAVTIMSGIYYIIFK